MSGAPGVEIVVDELVVRGLSPEVARATAAALEARFAALARQDAGVRGREEAFRRLPAVTAPAGRPDALGAAVADAVWGTLAPGRGGAAR